MRQAYQATAAEIADDLESFVNAVYESLESQFLVLPKGPVFIEYLRFQEAYEVLKRATRDFRELTPPAVWDALLADSLTLVVLRSILGMSAPEWAELAAADSQLAISQGFARSLDGSVRRDREYLARLNSRGAATLQRVEAMVETACGHIVAGVTERAPDTLHRLDKADTAEGLESVRRAADHHIPYSMLGRVPSSGVRGRPQGHPRFVISQAAIIATSTVASGLGGASVLAITSRLM